MLLVWSTFLVLLVNVPALSATTITVKTDRQDVGLNESFVMIFESDGSVDDDPDFSPLKKDFQILSRSSSSNMSIVNGKISSTKKWQLTVLARRAGKLVIPSVSFGKDRSQASFVNVNTGRGSISKPGTGDDIFLEVEVNDASPYVQAEVIYTVRLFLSVAVSNASLTEVPSTSADAIVERVAEDQRYQTRRGGKRYEVIERRYAIYPLASGRITIEAVTFQGQTSRSAFSIFDPFGPQPKTIVERSREVTLDVKPVPGSFPGNNWLPAKMLTVNESWSQEPPAFQVGEPITRTITLTARAQVASQLPVLDEWQVAEFKQYPDQPVLNDERKADGTIATRQEKTAIIPGSAGRYMLPGIKIPWWNTETDRLEYAELPAREVLVQAAPGSAPTPGDLAGLPQPGPLQLDEAEGDAPEPVAVVAEPATGFWQGLSAGLALAWLLTLFMWWRYSRRSPVAPADGERMLKSGKVINELKTACNQDNPADAKQALLDWARLNWGSDAPSSLGAIGKRSPARLASAIATLNDSLYSRESESWRGAELWQAFKEYRDTGENEPAGDTGELKPLYKI